MWETVTEQFSNHLSGETPLPPYQWNDLRKDADLCMQHEGEAFHEGMLPYYEMYINASEILFRDRANGRDMSRFVEHVISMDDRFAQWVSQQDLVAVVDKWIAAERSHEFMFILQQLVYQNYRADWASLQDKVYGALGKLEVCGDALSNEYYCILHGFMMIMKAPLSYSDRVRMYDQMRDNWEFLKHLYSVMLGRMVGLRINNFAQVANIVKLSPSHYPHLQLIHAAMKGRMNQLCPKADALKKLNAQLKEIERKIQHTPQSTELEALCKVLFPEDFSAMLDKYRYKPYSELQDRVKWLENNLAETQANLKAHTDMMAEDLRDAIDVVPVAEIENQLLKLDPQAAVQVFEKLNSMLVGNEAWARNAASIRDHVYERRQKFEAKLPKGISPELAENMVLELAPIFHNSKARAEEFVYCIANAKPKTVTEEVNLRVKKGIISESSRHRDLWQILHQYGLYTPTESNWNQQVK